MASTDQTDVLTRSSFFVPRRTDRAELLDLGVGSDEDVKANFDDLWRINRFLGGVQALTTHLYPRLAAHAGTPTVVDIGAGSGDIGDVIRQWAVRRGIQLHLWGLDLSARNLLLTQRREHLNAQTCVQADALHLPFKSGSVDYFISSLFLHHLPPEPLKALLAQTFESARKGIIMSDLTRGWLPLVAFKIGQPLFARNYLTRHDGTASIRRAYTPAELLHMAQAAGLANARVYQHWGWRMTLVAEK